MNKMRAMEIALSQKPVIDCPTCGGTGVNPDKSRKMRWYDLGHCPQCAGLCKKINNEYLWALFTLGEDPGEDLIKGTMRESYITSYRTTKRMASMKWEDDNVHDA